MAYPIKMILVPTQLDDPDASALRVAKRLAQESDASVCALHVIPIDPLVTAPAAPTDIYARDQERAKEELQRIADQHLGGIKHQLVTHFAWNGAANERIPKTGDSLAEQDEFELPGDFVSRSRPSATVRCYLEFESLHSPAEARPMRANNHSS